MNTVGQEELNEFGYTDTGMVGLRYGEALFFFLIDFEVYGLRADNSEGLIEEEQDLEDFEYFGLEKDNPKVIEAFKAINKEI